MTNKVALSGLSENVILIKILHTTDDNFGCVKSDTWCKMVLHQIVVQDTCLPTTVDMSTQAVCSLAPVMRVNWGRD